MRKVYSDSCGIEVFEENAAHTYMIEIPTPSAPGNLRMSVFFQNGPIKEFGNNGVTNEALLAILIDRTEQLNAQFPCRENSIAITKMQEALMWFEKRTKDRQARNVEGTSQA